MPGRNANPTTYRHGFNGMEKDDELKGNGNSYDFGARMYDPRLGGWLSLDPQFNKYSYVSPYNFTLNNPVLFIDPNGEEVTIHGDDAMPTFAELQKVTSLELKMDVNGKLSATLPNKPIVLSKVDVALLEAINDEDINVNLYTTKAEWMSLEDGSGVTPILVGVFEGSVIVNGKVETTQICNLDMAKKLETEGIDKAPNSVAHEILESYHGGKDNPGEGWNEKSYESAHQKANNDDDYNPGTENYYHDYFPTGKTDYGMKNSVKEVKLTDNSKESREKIFEKK